MDQPGRSAENRKDAPARPPGEIISRVLFVVGLLAMLVVVIIVARALG